MEQQQQAESEDSELAAILDEGLFGEETRPEGQGSREDGAAAIAGTSSGEEGAAAEHLEHQQPKRARREAEASGAQGAAQQAAQQQQQQQQELQAAGGNGGGNGDGGGSAGAAGGICPPHPGWWMDMCIRCGAVRPPPDAPGPHGGARAAAGGRGGEAAAADAAAAGAAAATTKIKHLHRCQALEVSAHEAARIATDGVQRLLASRRLVLVLDLDHTLLNTVRDCDLAGEERQAAERQLQRQAEAAAPAQQQQQQQDAQQQQQQPPPAGGPGAAATGARLYHLADKGLWTKLRPGVERFLEAASRLCELHIYTMGDKGYAGLMADLLDPAHSLFVGRVVSAADSTRSGVKDLDVLLADESLVLILDDTEQVWERHKANLVQVERYHYFGASLRMFEPGAASPLEQGADEPEAGGVLDNAAKLLGRVHARMFGPPGPAAAAEQQQQQQLQQQQGRGHEPAQQQELASANGEAEPSNQQQLQQPGRRTVRRPKPGGAQQPGGQQQAAAPALLARDVRQCLEEERRSVLAGCQVVFSRCWPQHQVPSEHPLWQMAERLGAGCSLAFTPGVTTHVVVAPDRGDPTGVPLTDKVQAAQRAGVPVVHPDWLVACKFAWAPQPAAAFALPGYSPAGRYGGARLLGPSGGRAASADRERERAAVMKAAGRADA